MPYRVDIYELVRSEYCVDEESADQTVDYEYRHGNLSKVCEISQDEYDSEEQE